MKSSAVVFVVSRWKRMRQCLNDITSHSTFDVGIVVLILLNTIVLALYHHGIDPKFRSILDWVNLVSVRPIQPVPVQIIAGLHRSGKSKGNQAFFKVREK